MKDFNLKEALAGAKVITVGGVEVTDLTMMNIAGVDNLVGVYKKGVQRWCTSGVSVIGCGHDDIALKIAPDMGSGFLYVFANGCTTMSKNSKSRGNYLNYSMCFDLSEYPIGFGL